MRPRLYTQYSLYRDHLLSGDVECWRLLCDQGQPPPSATVGVDGVFQPPALTQWSSGHGNMRAGSNKTYLNFKCSFMTFYTLCCCAWHMWHDTCSSSTQYSVQQNRYIGWKRSGSCVSLKIMIRGWSLAKLVTISRMVRMVIPYYGILYGGQCCVNVVLC